MKKTVFITAILVLLSGCAQSLNKISTPKPQEKPLEFKKGELDLYYSERIKLDVKTDKTEYNMGDAMLLTIGMTVNTRTPVPLPDKWVEHCSIRIRLPGYETGVELKKILGQPPVVLYPDREILHTLVFDNNFLSMFSSLHSDRYKLTSGPGHIKVWVSPPSEKDFISKDKGKIESNSVPVTIKGTHQILRGKHPPTYQIQTSHWIAQHTHEHELVRKYARQTLMSSLAKCYKYIKETADLKEDNVFTKAARSFLEEVTVKNGIIALLQPLECNDAELRMSLNILNVSETKITACKPQLLKTLPQIVSFEAKDSEGNMQALFPPENDIWDEKPFVSSILPEDKQADGQQTFFLHGWRTKDGKPLPPGRYTVTATYTVPDRLAKEHEGLWTGSIKSNSIEIIIPEPVEMNKDK